MVWEGDTRAGRSCKGVARGKRNYREKHRSGLGESKGGCYESVADESGDFC